MNMCAEWEEEERRTTEEEFRRSLPVSQISPPSQYEALFKNLIPQIKDFSQSNAYSLDEYSRLLFEAHNIVEEISYALNKHTTESLSGTIWTPPKIDFVQNKPKNWTDVSPIGSSALDVVTSRYLQRTWMQSNFLDWLLLNGFIFHEMVCLEDGIRSGAAFGKINWAYLFSGGDFEKSVYWQLGLEVSKLVARWIAVPLAIAGVYYAGYIDVAKWLGIVYGIYLIFHIILYPKRYLSRKKLRKEVDKLSKYVERLGAIYQASSSAVLNPSRLRDMIAKLEDEETFFKPAVYSILDRAIERDPAVFIARSG